MLHEKKIVALLLLTSNYALSSEPEFEMRLLGSVSGSKVGGPHPVSIHHYCHMRTVYVSIKSHSLQSFAMLWNQETNQPLKCKDYKGYTKWLSLDKKDRLELKSENLDYLTPENNVPEN